MEKKKSISRFLCLASLFSLLLAAPSQEQDPPDHWREVWALGALGSWWGVNLFAFEDYYYAYCTDSIRGRYIKFKCSNGYALHVAYLDLSGASLNGSIPRAIGEFPMLTHLDLSRNNLIGPIPAVLSKLTNLVFLDLSFNKLNGIIPPTLQNLNSLHFLYLGNNALTGHFSFNLANQRLEALDLSFNPISGIIESPNPDPSLNILGTFLEQGNTTDRKKLGIYNCLHVWSCSSTDLSYNITSFGINCGGSKYSSSSIIYYGDKDVKGGAFFYVDSETQWAVSNVGSAAPGSNVSVSSNWQIHPSLDEELYRTATTSPKSLRYFIFGLKDGNFSVNIHFAEIESGMQRGDRMFDVYIQGERMLTDFDILSETRPFTALVKSFHSQVNSSLIDIHFLQAARWTCCDSPRAQVLGPLVSAISLTRDEEGPEPPVTPEVLQNLAPPPVDYGREALRRRGKIAGITLLCTAVIFVASSVVYLWWISESIAGHVRLRTESPKS